MYAAIREIAAKKHCVIMRATGSFPVFAAEVVPDFAGLEVFSEPFEEELSVSGEE